MCSSLGGTQLDRGLSVVLLILPRWKNKYLHYLLSVVGTFRCKENQILDFLYLLCEIITNNLVPRETGFVAIADKIAL